MLDKDERERLSAGANVEAGTVVPAAEGETRVSTSSRSGCSRYATRNVCICPLLSRQLIEVQIVKGLPGLHGNKILRPVHNPRNNLA